MVAPNTPLIVTATHAGEGGHWYAQNGSQVATVPNAKGDRQIAPTIVHARKLDLAPGVTSILRCSDKPALNLWKQRQAILAALTLPRAQGETEADWLARVEFDMGQTAAKAAEEGTRIHAAIQSSVQRTPVDDQYRPHVDGVLAQLDIVCGPQGWRAEVGCASPWGYGTKADLSSNEWVVDFKGKDGDAAALDAEKTYDEHAMQLAATDYALGGAPRKCAICFVSRTHPGVARVAGVERPELVRGLAMFRALLTYWQHKNRFRPSWSEVA